MLLAGSTAAEAPHRASRGHAPVSLVGTSQRDSNALRTQRSAAPSRARAVGGPGADLLRGKRGAPTKSVDLRNWLGCNGRSVWLEAALASPGPYFRILTFSTVFFRYIQLASSGVVPGVPWDSHGELIVCILSSQTNFLSHKSHFTLQCRGRRRGVISMLLPRPLPRFQTHSWNTLTGPYFTLDKAVKATLRPEPPLVRHARVTARTRTHQSAM